MGILPESFLVLILEGELILISDLTLIIHNLDPEGVIFFLPATIDDFETVTEPITCRFYSAHFCFTTGLFCREVQHDPNYYFHGEEISIAVRAYTHGYDLFTPHKMIAWHEYTRRYRKKHWDDNNSWSVLNSNTYIRLRNLLGIDGANDDIDLGIYGLGNVRSLSDYERYAGINFKRRGVTTVYIRSQVTTQSCYIG